MDLENQRRVKEFAEQFGPENVVVVVGAAEGEAAGLAAETVENGDPTFAGPLTGVQLGLACYHVCEPEMKEEFGLDYNIPDGGVYIWVRLPEGMNSRKLLREAQKRRLTFMPGHVFFPRKNMGARYFRLNFSYPTEVEIDRGMDILHDCLCNWHTNKL